MSITQIEGVPEFKDGKVRRFKDARLRATIQELLNNDIYLKSAVDLLGSGRDVISFYEGPTNAPPMVDIDTDFKFEAAAKFEPSVNQDIIFSVFPLGRYLSGLRVGLIHTMTPADTGNIQLLFDYRVKDVGDSAGGGTDYVDTLTFNPVDVGDTIELNTTTLVIPSGRISANTQVVYCKLTRLGTDASDTHTGSFVVRGLSVLDGSS